MATREENIHSLRVAYIALGQVTIQDFIEPQDVEDMQCAYTIISRQLTRMEALPEKDSVGDGDNVEHLYM